MQRFEALGWGFLGDGDATKDAISPFSCFTLFMTLATVSSHLSCWNLRIINTCLLLHWVKQQKKGKQNWLVSSQSGSHYWQSHTLYDQLPGFHHRKQQHGVQTPSSCWSRHQGQEGQGMNKLCFVSRVRASPRVINQFMKRVLSRQATALQLIGALSGKWRQLQRYLQKWIIKSCLVCY